MGVLTGAFGKLQMGSYYRNLQNQLMGVQSSLRRATRQVKSYEDQISRLEKSQNNQITTLQYQLKAQNSASILSQLGVTDMAQMTSEQSARYTQMVSAADASIMQQISSAQQRNSDYVQYLRDFVLAAAKDEEDYLQGKKDSLESQVNSVKEDYQACKKMEEQDWQMFKPNYTGGSNG